MILFTAYCDIIYNNQVIRVLLIMEIAYLILSIIMLLIHRKKFTVDFYSKVNITEKNNKFPLTVKITNLGTFWTVNCCVILRVTNLATGQKTKIRRRAVVRRKKSEILTIPLVIKECGNVKIEILKLEIWDAFYLLKFGFRVDKNTHVGVLPELHLVPVEICRRTREFITDADEFSNKEKGEDASEIYQIRDYRAGDSVRDIHWKLSAKEDELMIKEKSKPLGSAVLVWLDLSDEHTQKINRIKAFGKRKQIKREREVVSNMFEIVASISVSLLQEECIHIVTWYEPQNQEFYAKKISKEEHLYELMYRLLYVEPYDSNKKANVKLQFDDMFKNMEFSTSVIVDNDKELYVGNKKVKVPIVKNKVRWNNFYLEV